MRQVTAGVRGMHCAGCVGKVVGGQFHRGLVVNSLRLRRWRPSRVSSGSGWIAA
jgi:hypothetical protein